ncbi:MAG: S-layer homology domain-containing protein, partial [Bacillota bacterium]|nr:S-layer homology domain-containing protein [Bacillota bacterium]
LTTSSEERYTSNNTTSFMLTKRLPSIPLEVMVLNQANSKDKIAVELAVGNVYTSKITGNVIAELCEKTSDKIIETKQQISSVDINQFNYVTFQFSKNAPYTGNYYLRLNIAKPEGSTLPESITKLCNQLVFDLPVYQDGGSNDQNGGNNANNPGGAIIVPGSNSQNTQQQSSNAKISSLKIDKGTLSPAFDKNTALYDLTIDNEVKEIRLSLSTDDSKASLIVDGVSKANSVVNYPVSVPVEKTRLEIKVKAENGDIKTYIINIKRKIVIDDGKKPSSDLDQFSDVNDHWAKDYIMSLAKLGIMSGYPDKTFKPNNKITRAEAAVVLIKIFNQLPAKDAKLSFSDEAKIPSWSYGYIKTAVDKGWIKGYGDKTFKANNLITRQEFAAMFLRAIGYKDLKPAKTNFADDAKIGSWAKGYIAKAAELGLIGGYQDKTFKPEGNISRAEVCVIAKKYLDKK